ncbi:DNA polymerase alpha catalytic subunit [Gracilariopsis chorda]|uniref:DNA polymerase alpha catalytic subunit n=1 Tax=Gracilariopsis chorda TaxID=448386 RepID=A0A2V3IL54_9FLOR|nr:DNA polymerase alpha catalytic subunit [Gracilariopsis chorda]|eukprot:PXF42825.1 DNA polymerase alpha catalytic subunit [Gracilariopsis chorda]
MEARTSGRLAANLSVLPLTKQLTCISGNIWSHSLRGSRTERIEYLLCHEFKLFGSRIGGNAASAGNVGANLLLTDKLNRSEREKLLQMYENEQSKLRKKETGIANNDHVFGGPGGNENDGVGELRKLLRTSVALTL